MKLRTRRGEIRPDGRDPTEHLLQLVACGKQRAIIDRVVRLDIDASEPQALGIEALLRGLDGLDRALPVTRSHDRDESDEARKLMHGRRE